MNIGIRFCSVRKTTKGKTVSELLKAHLENTSELSFLLIMFSSELKKYVSTDKHSASSENAALR